MVNAGTRFIRENGQFYHAPVKASFQEIPKWPIFSDTLGSSSRCSKTKSTNGKEKNQRKAIFVNLDMINL